MLDLGSAGCQLKFVRLQNEVLKKFDDAEREKKVVTNNCAQVVTKSKSCSVTQFLHTQKEPREELLREEARKVFL